MRAIRIKNESIVKSIVDRETPYLICERSLLSHLGFPEDIVKSALAEEVHVAAPVTPLAVSTHGSFFAGAVGHVYSAEFCLIVLELVSKLKGDDQDLREVIKLAVRLVLSEEEAQRIINGIDLGSIAVPTRRSLPPWYFKLDVIMMKLEPIPL